MAPGLTPMNKPIVEHGGPIYSHDDEESGNDEDHHTDMMIIILNDDNDDGKNGWKVSI